MKEKLFTTICAQFISRLNFILMNLNYQKLSFIFIGLLLTQLALAASGVTFINTNAQWKYLDNGSNQGTNWRATAFNDAGWKTGNAELGYGDGGEATVISYGPSSNNKHITTYFRRSFNVADAAAVLSLNLRILRDDGAVVYLNGTQVYRTNMPGGNVTYTTLASSNVDGTDETKYLVAAIDKSLLINGTNVIAVELHQADVTSSDVSFNFNLTGTVVGALIASNASWKYLANGSNQGAAWKTIGFNDAPWASGNAELGYGDGDEVTPVSFGPDDSKKYITTYFRKKFTVENPLDIASLNLKLIRDDGAVVYLNGTEVYRTNMPAGVISSTTFASVAIGEPDESTWYSSNVDKNLLVAGQNVIAVEIHQSDLTSSDLSFNFELNAKHNTSTANTLHLWSGGLTPTSIVVSAKVSANATTRLAVDDDPNFKSPVYSLPVIAGPSNNRVVKHTVSGLTANTNYHYAIEINGTLDRTSVNAEGRFRTPGIGAYSFKFAVSTCSTTGSNSVVFDNIRNEKPLFYLMGGDMHYNDIATNDPTLFYDAYEGVLSNTKQQDLYKNVPMAYMWDDHDFGPNDSDANSPSKAASRQAYRDYIPHYSLAAGPGNAPIYQSFVIGRIKFILTDLRSEKIIGGTAMGSAQKTWFKNELLAAKNNKQFVVWHSTYPYIQSSTNPDSDGWGNHGEERNEIANYMKSIGLSKILITAGDAHMLAIDNGTNSDYATGGGGTKAVVFHAAALDNGGSIKGGPYSHGAYAGGGQYGLVEVNDNGSDICFVLHGKDVNLANDEVSYSFCESAVNRNTGSRLSTDSSSARMNLTEEILHSNVSLYPNPAKDEIKINFDTKVAEEVWVSILDLQSKVILRLKGDTRKGNNQFIIDVSGLKPGSYLLRINGNNCLINKKIIIQE